MKPSNRAADFIRRVVDNLNVAEDVRLGASLITSWRELAGDELGLNSRPVDITKGILWIEVSHPGWIQKLNMAKNMLLGQIRRKYPTLKINGLAFRINQVLEEEQQIKKPDPVQSEESEISDKKTMLEVLEKLKTEAQQRESRVDS